MSECGKSRAVLDRSASASASTPSMRSAAAATTGSGVNGKSLP